MSCTYDDAQVLIVLRPNDFIAVSTLGCHPQIETSHFLYYNSDGSGPTILKSSDMNNPKLLIENLIKYYREFMNDRYH